LKRKLLRRMERNKERLEADPVFREKVLTYNVRRGLPHRAWPRGEQR